ncbi:MAG: peptidase [Bacteroidia bacterium]|nr:MAG: peptidase [Bacteroidia bacterium]
MLATRYRFNSETFHFEKVKLDKKDIILQIKKGFLAGLLFSAFLIVFCYVFIGSPKALYLSQKLAYNQSVINQQIEQIASLYTPLEKVHQLENGFYKSLLNIKPLDENIWNAGQGGSTHSLSNDLPEIQKSKKLVSDLKRKIEIQNRSFDEVHQIAEKKQEELQAMPAIKPINTRIVSGFGYRNDPYLGHWHLHTGLDFHAYMNMPVKATAGGRVICAGYSATGQGYGIQVEIDHGNGYVTKYAHLSKVKVKYGQKVKRGEIIGLTGSTGWSTGPHLHYEVIKNGVKVDPIHYFHKF